MKLLVCGGRDYRDKVYLEAGLVDMWKAARSGDGLTIICGYDPWSKRYQGADQLAYEWAKSVGVPVMTFPAPWHVMGNSAGPARNRRMFEDSQPDQVMWFPGGRGTAHMVGIARAAGMEPLEG